ncbi:DNA alkylation repair protein [Candidatus Woesearchaeota archaeon]|nr:DNA alkylation repair protein [Candidatus Woesearchaeota archaeon]
MLDELIKELKKYARSQDVEQLGRFFKTGKGEYGEGDSFIGVRVPDMRTVAKGFMDMSYEYLQKLLQDKVHEYRQIALIILVNKFKKVGEEEKKKIFDFYLKHTKFINNWDLVDLSAPTIVGGYLLDKKRDILYKLAKSRNLWEKRIAIIATAAFIAKKQYKDTLKISEILLKDNHDLIHKAVGWMLREVGKKDQKVLEGFLKKYHKQMPRTMLRYAIEKLDVKKRKFYMKK